MPRTVIDAQIHLWERDSPDRPWLAHARAYAHGEELTAEQALAHMDGAGVHRAVLVPPSWVGDRNDTCLDAARAYPDRFAIVGRFPIEDPAQREKLANWRETPGMLGVRLTFRNEVQRPWLTDGTADWFWREAERIGIPVMVFVPGSLPAVAVIAERHPGLRLIIDHLALFDVRDDAIFEQLPDVLDLARFPNVAAKASCMPSLVTEPYPFPTLQRAIREVVEAFGPKRTFWGSDVSRLTCSYADNMRLFTEACPFLSDEDLDWIMGGAIAEWLKWG